MIRIINNIRHLILFTIVLLPSLLFGQGSNYTGPYEKSLSLEYKEKNDFVIDGLEFSSSDGKCITLWGCENVVIRNCKFKDVFVDAAVYVQGSTNVTITNCQFENVQAGLIVSRGKGGIKFENNSVKNIVGDLHGGSRFSQAVQFIESNGPGNSISYNVIENIPGESFPEDIINIFHSNGTAESPIIIKGNWIRGGGPSASGGGILMGDWGGSYQIAEDNILVNPGQYGMGIGGGHDIILRNNKIYAKQQPFTNVGLSICNWTQKETGPSSNIIVENNSINWTNKEGAISTAWVYENMHDACPDWQKASIPDLSITEDILPNNILNRNALEAKEQ